MKELLYNELLMWYEFRWSDNGFNEFHGIVEAAVFVSIFEYMLSVCRLRVVGSYVPSVFSMSDGYVPIRLTYICLITGHAFEFVDSTSVVCGVI